jgi:hypothetical protein
MLEQFQKPQQLQMFEQPQNWHVNVILKAMNN